MPRVCKIDRDALLSAVREHGPASIGTLSIRVLGYHSPEHKALNIALHELVRAGLIKHEDQRRGTKVRHLFSATGAA